MTDQRLAEIVELLAPRRGRRPWFGGASAVGCLRGVSHEQAEWKPAPDRHSIWEFTLHIAYWKYAVRRNLEEAPAGGFPRAPANWPAVPSRPDATSWREDCRLLRSEHESLLAAVNAFDARRLDEMVPGSRAYRYADLLYGIVMHDVYHVGQIQLLKRLYRSRPSRRR